MRANVARFTARLYYIKRECLSVCLSYHFKQPNGCVIMGAQYIILKLLTSIGAGALWKSMATKAEWVMSIKRFNPMHWDWQKFFFLFSYRVIYQSIAYDETTTKQKTKVYGHHPFKSYRASKSRFWRFGPFLRISHFC